ncbi:MAG: ABC transporter ATP-binding protein [Clostridia bacterium]|nr:ABC transporter ATP-binding protein [Clostridia bacterium]
MAIIEVTALSKYYGKYMSIERVGFTVEKGEIFGIVGGEDAGKTTVLDILAGAVKPTSGSCVVCGLDVHQNAQQAARMIRVVSQNGETYSKIRAKNVEKYLKSLAQENARQRAQRWFAYFGIGENEVLRRMSKQKKTALYLIDVLLTMPRIVMLDDPFEGADQDFIGRMSRFLANENKRGLTLVITARSKEQIAHLCTRIAVMNEGRMSVADTPAQSQQAVMPPQEPQQSFAQQEFAQAQPEPMPMDDPLQFDQQTTPAQDPYRAQMEEEQAFAQMRRDFYAGNTVRQPSLRNQESRGNHADMFRQLEHDFFDAPQRQAPAPAPAQQNMADPASLDQTRRFSMSVYYKASADMAGDPYKNTAAYPRFDERYSRPYAQAAQAYAPQKEQMRQQTAQDPYRSRGQEPSMKQPSMQQPSMQDAYARQGAYDAFAAAPRYQNERAARHAADDFAPLQQRAAQGFEVPRAAAHAREEFDMGAHRSAYGAHAKQQPAYEHTAFDAEAYGRNHYEDAMQEDRTTRAGFENAYKPSYERAQEPSAQASYESSYKPSYESSFDHRSFDQSSFESSYERRHGYESAYEQPAQQHHAAQQNTSRHAAKEEFDGPRAYSSYKNTANYANAQQGVKQENAQQENYQSRYEGRHARPAHSRENFSEETYSAQQNTGRQTRHANVADYPLYSSQHNASVHVPATQGNRRIVLVADNVPVDFLRSIGATGLHKDGDRVEFFFNGQMDRLIVALSQMNVRDLRVSMDVPVSGF